ncbi:MAG: carbamoyl-phosphate synthase small chain [Planctomycetota bacterium]|nr:MAG: carbamoyl-phosphate synthase small chain [Planctomycetota bacterium]
MLVLEDGRAFYGTSVGAPGEAVAEVVFNTSMTGYQEILTDPSYWGQIVVMTAAQIGNYGVCAADEEAARPMARGFVLDRCCPVPSNARAAASLPDYLRRHGVVALAEVDTRALVRHLRSRGVMRGIAVCGQPIPPREELLARVRAAPPMQGLDLAREVSCAVPYVWGEEQPATGGAAAADSERLPVVVLDCGIKRSSLRALHRLGCRVTVVPATESAEDILARRPAGVLLSNGPGDPAAVGYAIETVRGLLGRVPLFGICLGHQILALALGGRTYKLKFGHRGGNQPVQDLRTGRVYISAHNHGFAVDFESLSASEVEPWFVALNDGTNEGLRCRSFAAASVQFHPEAAPGPNDLRWLFEAWVAELRARTGAGG